jgi:alpha-glucosidase
VAGGMEKWVVADIDKIPLFVKEGAIIPKYPVQQYVGELQLKELYLDVYYKLGIENSTVYEDAQDGFDYKKGRYSLRNFKLNGKQKELIIQQFKDGTFITPYDKFEIKIHGLPFEITSIMVDNEKVTLEDVKLAEYNTVKVSKGFTTLQLLGN